MGLELGDIAMLEMKNVVGEIGVAAALCCIVGWI